MTVPEDVKEVGEVAAEMGGEDGHHGEQVEQGAKQDDEVLLRLEHLQPLAEQCVLANLGQPGRLLPHEAAEHGERGRPRRAASPHALAHPVHQELVVGLGHGKQQLQEARRLGGGGGELVVERVDEPRVLRLGGEVLAHDLLHLLHEAAVAALQQPEHLFHARCGRHRRRRLRRGRGHGARCARSVGRARLSCLSDSVRPSRHVRWATHTAGTNHHDSLFRSPCQ